MRILMLVVGLLICVPTRYLLAQVTSTGTVHKTTNMANTEESIKAVEQRNTERVSGVDARLPWEKVTGYARHKMLSQIKGSHKVKIYPVRPNTGITTGLVIAYGHVIRGPYLLEDIDGKLMINGVQVLPSLVLEKIKKSKKPLTESAASQKISKIRRDAQMYYKSHVKTLPKETVHKNIFDMLNNSTDVFKNPEWQKDESILVELADGGLRYRIGFSEAELSDQDSVYKSLTKERLKKNREDFLNLFKGALEQGDTLVFLSDGSQVDGEGVQKKVLPVMKENGLTREQQIEKLHSTGIGYGFAEDIVDNYANDEWAHP